VHSLHQSRRQRQEGTREPLQVRLAPGNGGKTRSGPAPARSADAIEVALPRTTTLWSFGVASATSSKLPKKMSLGLGDDFPDGTGSLSFSVATLRANPA
jgi:hypothetical protein